MGTKFRLVFQRKAGCSSFNAFKWKKNKTKQNRQVKIPSMRDERFRRYSPPLFARQVQSTRAYTLDFRAHHSVILLIVIWIRRAQTDFLIGHALLAALVWAVCFNMVKKLMCLSSLQFFWHADVCINLK